MIKSMNCSLAAVIMKILLEPLFFGADTVVLLTTHYFE